jgi:hypothetical protein
MSYHTTTPKILDTLILSLVLVPTKTNATTLDLFLTFLTQWKFSCQDFSHSVFLIKFCFYLFTTPQNQNQTTFFSPPSKSNHLASLFVTRLHFLTYLKIFFFISSLCLPKISLPILLIHRFLEVFSLGYTNCIPS